MAQAAVRDEAARAKSALPHRSGRTEEAPSGTQSEATPKQEASENVVIFTSYDGTTREVGDLPSNLGRATALANEKSVSKIWDTPEEEAACHAMQKGR